MVLYKSSQVSSSFTDFLILFQSSSSICNFLLSLLERKQERKKEKMTQSSPKVTFTPEQLEHINLKLSELKPQDVLKWAILTIPDLFQTTAFGLTGLVINDMVSKLGADYPPVELIFLDTLHHFKETLSLVDELKARYPHVKLHVFKPQGVETEQEFAEEYGEKLWETNELYYDYLVKVEPAQRAYEQLNVAAVFTGRRRSQGGQRGNIPIVQVEEDGFIKINPLANWTFEDVKNYIKENDVPYNVLLDQGYRSVGDYHSTVPVKDGEDERAGRWKGKSKTECGIHETSKFAQFLKQQDAQVA